MYPCVVVWGGNERIEKMGREILIASIASVILGIAFLVAILTMVWIAAGGKKEF
ncbi:hypothetical protein SAMN06265339_0674 [Desulfurobacterium pacificum]|uniref:Uncharacterized protein n=1 Tax=Desulfurobacterium pacificum TaxID=240166 RepID=A0ABY1NJ32_9BACT|nr:hypothetical protein SAMN06265339_0674 [Desulfurobacterium pacificum]